MNQNILFIGPSGSGKSYLANLPNKNEEKYIESTVGIDYRTHRIGNTKYIIYDTGDLNRYYFIIKEYLSKVDEIFVFVNTHEDLENCKKKLNDFNFKIVSDNTTLNPDFLLSFTNNDLDFYNNEEFLPLLKKKKRNLFCCFT